MTVPMELIPYHRMHPLKAYGTEDHDRSRVARFKDTVNSLVGVCHTRLLHVRICYLSEFRNCVV